METNVNILQQADIFYQLGKPELELIAKLCEERTYKTGEIIFFERTKSDELYIIAQGTVDIMVNPNLVSDKPEDDNTPVTIATLRRGQSFGEIALVDQGLRSATARVAQDDTKLLIIPSNQLKQVCLANPNLGYQLMFNLAADLALKIRSTDLRIREELLYGRARK